MVAGKSNPNSLLLYRNLPSKSIEEPGAMKSLGTDVDGKVPPLGRKAGLFVGSFAACTFNFQLCQSPHECLLRPGA